MVYIIFACWWIIFSDSLLALLVRDAEQLTTAQTYKGSVFVIVTGILVFFILKREFRARQQVEEELSEHRDKLEEIVINRTRELKIANEQFYRISKAVEGTSDAIGITDTDKKLVYQNNAHLRLFGYTMEEINALGGVTALFNNPKVADDLFQTIRRGNSWNGEAELLTKTGRTVSTFLRADAITNDTGEIIDLITLHTDLTERKLLDKEIARLDSMHLIGEMAAGLGHEIRNPMTAVRGFLQILMGKSDCVGYNNYFEVMIEELDRANSIITEYLSLAKNKKVDLKVQNLNKILHAFLPLIVADAALSGQEIKVESGDIPDLLLDEKEIRQLIFNLVRNGLEAMSSGGNLLIKTYRESNRVVLAVKDQGTGIKSEIMDKIGTPFFTSKDQGTGLGLAICYSIAARHNAVIKIETGETGTTFFVIFKMAGI